MITQILNCKNKEDICQAMLTIGCDPKGIEIMLSKADFKAIKVFGLKPAAANILKQEMLALGGEAGVAYGAINCSIASSDALIFGTLAQIDDLVAKLSMHQFGLPQIALDIKKALSNYQRSQYVFKAKDQALALGQKTALMGILNVTPDSFSDAGKYFELEAAMAHAHEMIQAGADIIDVGGESTRPGASPVSREEEKQRVLPVIKELSKNKKIIISIDTCKAEVADAALQAGAHMVNDISGLNFDPAMAEVAAKHKAGICLMHIKGSPANMQNDPQYIDLIVEIMEYLSVGLEKAQNTGILLENIILDPGIGFGKKLEHNLEILRKLKQFKSLGAPLLVGLSNKAFIGAILNCEVSDRFEGTAAACALAIANGADVLRVHEVAKISKVVKITDELIRR